MLIRLYFASPIGSIKRKGGKGEEGEEVAGKEIQNEGRQVKRFFTLLPYFPPLLFCTKYYTSKCDILFAFRRFYNTFHG